MGRPTDNPKTTVKRARMSTDDLNKLTECCEKLNMSESDVLRMGINEVYKKVQEL